MLFRREFLAAAAALPLRAAPPMVDTHIHLFDPQRFPYHKSAVYKPPASTLDAYAGFVRQAGLAHTVIVHPEPYQDDHSYLEYCFAHEPSKGYFKGTCLFDPIAAETPARMAELVKRNPGRIVALRIHENRKPGEAPTTSGAIRDRDLKHPNVRKTWRAAHELGLAIQMHFIPYHAREIAGLAAEFRDTPVILDHLARAGQGTPQEYSEVLKMAKLPKVYMKFSGVRYSSKEEAPYRDAKPLVRRTFDAFGPDRMIWGGVGANPGDHKIAVAVFEEHFAFASAGDRDKIRAMTAMKLFRF